MKSLFSKPKDRSLKQNFLAIQFFIGFLPITLASLIFISLAYLEESRRRELFEFQKRQISSEIHRHLSLLEKEAESLLQSSEFTEYLLAPEAMRPYLENRVYGKITERAQQFSLPTSWILTGARGRNLVKGGSYNWELERALEVELEKVPHRSPYQIVNGSLVLRREIRLDDQEQNGPNAKLLGNLIVAVPVRALESQFEDQIIIGSFFDPQKADSLQISFKDSSNSYQLLIILLGGIYLATTLSIIYGIKRARNLVVLPIEALSRKVLNRVENAPAVQAKNEIKVLETAIEAFEENLHQLHLKTLEAEKSQLLEQTARQVSHDIRSPLSALNLVVNSLDKVPEEKRLILRSATSRINDIANTLLNKAKPEIITVTESNDNSTGRLVTTVELIPAIVDMLISEKRIQYRDRMRVEIVADLSNSYGCFAEINQREFKRVLSNLINNSIEALNEESGTITVAVTGKEGFIDVLIDDNGIGIPKDILLKLGSQPLTFGKTGSQCGSGLGLFHARRAIEQFGGTLKIESREAIGTQVKISLPRAEAPSWFVEALDLRCFQRALIVDDDSTIHQIWNNRLGGFPLVHFTSGDDFQRWFHDHDHSSSLYLIDFELLGQKRTGIDLIRELNIGRSAFLVTSRYDEDAIRKAAESLNVKIIPKTMASLLPISAPTAFS